MNNTNSIKAIIVDDEQHCIDMLITMLQKYFPEIEVAAGCRSVTEAVKSIEEYHPELVFLDVEMPHNNGFELLRHFEKPFFDVIFISAFENYALRAIKFNALDYLLKPFSKSDLTEAIEKFKEKRKASNIPNPALEIFMQNFRTTQQVRRKISLPTMNGLIFVLVQDIIRCESAGNYTKFFLVNKTTHVVSRSLKEFEYLLEEMNFYRVHHSHLINLQHMHSYIQGEGGFALMSDGAQVEISRRRKADFLKRAAQL